MLNHRAIIVTSLFISLNFLLGCQNEETPQAQRAETSAIQTAVQSSAAQSAAQLAKTPAGTVIESIDASVYTYVQVEMDGENIWLAGPKTTITKGGSINVDRHAPMTNFHSKSLNRDFPVVYFVSGFAGSAVQSASALPSAPAPTISAPSSATELPAGHQAIADIKTMASKTMALSQPVERAEDGQTIAEIIANKKELSGKVVKVRGKVTKFTGGVMGKNWIHMIDGSADNDLTVTTDQVVTTEQIIVIEGTVILDKDFGYGYAYELLIEDAKVAVE